MPGKPPQTDGVGFLSAGVEFAAVFGALLGGGVGLDLWLGTIPAFTVAGGVLGFAGALWRLVRDVRPLAGGDDPGPENADDA